VLLLKYILLLQGKIEKLNLTSLLRLAHTEHPAVQP
jgi:hypothetical protein